LINLAATDVAFILISRLFLSVFRNQESKDQLHRWCGGRKKIRHLILGTKNIKAHFSRENPLLIVESLSVLILVSDVP